VGSDGRKVSKILGRVVSTNAVVAQMAAIQILPLAFIVPILALAIILAAAMAHPVLRSLGFLISLLVRLAKVIEINDLGHTFAPSINSGAALSACCFKTPEPKQFHPYLAQ